ncbi:hypothetical protein LCGC14_1753640 [marine sediment metagenome]|uniref:Uncharacterized protein n=1 Tax=marine sediment metagenome TaxID=412755 RepID=A0A0F9H383_9ZZZZ
MSFDITKVTLLRQRDGLDSIYFKLTDAMARLIHGKYYDFHGAASLTLRVTYRRGEEALEQLNIDPRIIEIIDVENLAGPQPKFSSNE